MNIERQAIAEAAAAAAPPKKTASGGMGAGGLGMPFDPQDPAQVKEFFLREMSTGQQLLKAGTHLASHMLPTALSRVHRLRMADVHHGTSPCCPAYRCDTVLSSPVSNTGKAEIAVKHLANALRVYSEQQQLLGIFQQQMSPEVFQLLIKELQQ